MKSYLSIVFFVIAVLFSSTSFAYRFDTELGLTVSHYTYEEPDFMDLKGYNIGGDYIGTLFFDSDFFIRGNVLGAYGKHDYSSPISGTMSDDPSWYINARALFGKKFNFDGGDFSPYAGLGYRYLNNDSAGMTSSAKTRNKGYLRESNYYYVPIGFNFGIDLPVKSQIIFGAEYDYLIVGKQISYYSGISGDPDVTNTQDSGYGLRFNLRYFISGFSIGPYLIYWDIKDSDCVGRRETVEPANTTLEFGLRVAYRL